MDWEAIVPVAGTGLAALAAGASWASVRQGQRVWRASVQPDLRLILQTRQAENDARLVILNAGGGTATEAIYIIVGKGRRCERYVGDGFIPPGTKVTIKAEIPFVEAEDAGLDCLVGYKTLDGSLWYVTRAGKRKRLRRGSRWRPDWEMRQEKVWTRAFPRLPYPSRKTPSEVVAHERDGSL